MHAHIVSLAKKHPKQIAFLTCDEGGNIVEEITYGELPKKIEAAAGYLKRLGAEEGDRVALAFKNSAELLILSWAAWSVGIVTVPLDVKRDTGELYKYKITTNNATLLIAQKGILTGVDPSHLSDVTVVEFSGFPERGSEKIAWKTDSGHLALILFTSGTTGYPKGAKLSLQNLIVNADGIREWLRITDKDRFLVELPLHHINSTTFCLSALLAGASIAIPPTYSNSHFWQQVARTGATFTSIVQSILFDQVSRKKEYESVKSDLRLNRIQIGSAPVVVHTMQEFMTAFGIPLYQGYGQTETALRVTGVPMGLPADLYDRQIEENSIGSPMSWADLKIADENGKILGENEEGELAVRGPAVMEGYIGGEEAFRNGYFLTGDVGVYRLIEDKKFFFLKGRKKELIIKGGVNISPVAIENQLKKISRDIDQVYVIGFPDERYSEEIAAAICWKKDIDVSAAVRKLKMTLLAGTPLLSSYETPLYFASISPDELPVTSTGKVQRVILKKELGRDRFDRIHDLFRTATHRFSVLNTQSSLVATSHALYNHCWQPLTIGEAQYKRDISKQFILVAIDSTEQLAGQIAIIRTGLSEQELLHVTYDELLTNKVLDSHGGALVCISICSADFQPKPVPEVKYIPDPDRVRAYIRAGNDPVMRFHQKPKGGLESGAELVDVIPGGRPEDKSACGYNMLLKYPTPDGATLTPQAPLSNQLIEGALLMADDLGIERVYAFSRPGGLAYYLSKQAG